MRPVDAVSVPVIDLAPARAAAADRLRVAAAIDAACREIGFFAIDGHGVPARVVDELRAVAHAFFAMPREDKLAARHPEAGTNRGYHPVGGEALSSANVAPAPPPDFERAATVYYRAMSELVPSLMRLAALALSVDETFFDDKVDRSVGTMRLNYYPAQARLPTPGQLRAGAHTDYGGFTILSGEDVPGGLQVRTRDGRWVDVATTPTRFVVNIGDLLMRWTNDRWLSNMHRVVNPPAGAGRPRLSIAFFN